MSTQRSMFLIINTYSINRVEIMGYPPVKGIFQVNSSLPLGERYYYKLRGL
jgi:hypothetical protein